MAAWSLLLAAAVAAQPPLGRVSGRVVGPDDRPLAGARVRAWPAARPEAGSESTTDADGRWRLVALEAGRWQIEIAADGYFPAAGWFRVLSSGPGPTVDVELRSLEETSPSLAENRSTVLRWVEKGNALLAQGRPAAARAEYERALVALPRAERPELLQAIARTHYLEGELDLSIERLQEAIGIAPGRADLEQLLRALLDGAGRLAEAESLLAEAARNAAGVDEASAGAGARPEPPSPEGLPRLTAPVEALPGRVGRFRTVFSERSPLSGVGPYLERFRLAEADLRAADPAAASYELEDESFELFVPESYAAAAPHGLLVWVSPTSYGGFGNPGIARVLGERRLIWIGAHDSGNGRLDRYRVGLALDAVHNARKLYAIDERRIYVAGYSGGGRVASQLAMLYPEVFDGGLFLYGCDYFEPLPVPDRPGSLWPARIPALPDGALERLKSDSRFVLLTGDRDFNRAQTKRIYQAMRASGFEHLTYLQIPDADHYFGLPPEWLEEALAALDEALE